MRVKTKGSFVSVVGTDKQCTAMAKTTRVRCKKPVMPGCNVCSRHGGLAPQVREAGQKRISEAKARERANAYLERHGIEVISPVDDPIERLAYAAGEAKAMADFFATRIEELRYKGQAGEQLRAEVALHERWYDRYTKLLAEQVRLGISERRVRIEEAQVMLMAQAIREILNRLDLNATQRVLATRVVPEVLRELEASTGRA